MSVMGVDLLERTVSGDAAPRAAAILGVVVDAALDVNLFVESLRAMFALDGRLATVLAGAVVLGAADPAIAADLAFSLDGRGVSFDDG